jgi:hypothetical protein
MEYLYPNKNYTLNPNIYQYQSFHSNRPETRSINIIDEATSLNRKSLFSFAVIEMLQITSALKLQLLQVMNDFDVYLYLYINKYTLMLFVYFYYFLL